MSTHPAEKSNAQTISIIAIVVSVLCSIVGAVVGLFMAISARKKAVTFGEPTGLPTTALVISIVFIVVNIVAIITNITLLSSLGGAR